MTSIPRKIELDSIELRDFVAHVQTELAKGRSLDSIAKNDFVDYEGKPATSCKLRYRLIRAGYQYKALGTLVPITPVEPTRTRRTAAKA